MLRLFGKISVCLAVILSFMVHGISQAGSAPEKNHPARPNVLLIVADDLGYSDLGVYGSEIATPHLDQLAKKGVQYSQFYAAPTCSPTRAMLLTGVDHHLAGLGNMAELMAPNQRGLPGYEGHLNDRVVTIAEILQDNGYFTAMTGKWHLGLKEMQGPHARGFEKSFTLLQGGASYFADMRGPLAGQEVAEYRENGEKVRRLPDGFYATDYYTDKLISYLSAREDRNRPFFAYLAYTAPHWPLQAPDEYLEKYRRKYDQGYDQLRMERFKRQQALGLVAKRARLPSVDSTVRPWNSLSGDEQRQQSRIMEVYAAMIANMDANIGRLISYLQERGELDNTIILFVSDNGPEGGRLQSDLFKEWIAQHDNSLENIGRPLSFVTTGPGWAGASAAPLRLFKGFPAEGGIRVPAILYYAQGAGGVRSDRIMTVKDVAPTILDILGISHPGTAYQGRSVHPMSGHSHKPEILQQDAVTATPQVWELFGRRAVRQGKWKALYVEPPHGAGRWQLYNLAKDPGETKDVSARHGNTLSELIKAYDAYAGTNNVVLPSQIGVDY